MPNDDEPEIPSPLSPIETKRKLELEHLANIELKTTVKEIVKTEGQSTTPGQSRQPEKKESEQKSRPEEKKKEPEEDNKDKEPDKDKEEDQQQPAQDDEDEEEEEEVTVPSVIGQNPESAKQALQNEGLESSEEVVGKAKEAVVTASKPSAGEKVKKGETVTLMVMEAEEEDEDKDKEGEEKPEGEPAEGLGEGAAGGAEAAERAAVAETGAAAGAEAGAAVGGSAVAVTAPFWGPALAIIAGIVVVLGLAFFILMVMIAKCNESSLTGVAVRTASWIGIIPGDICAKLAINHGGQSGGGGGGASFWEPADLVALSGVSVDSQTSDPRVRQCMLGKVQQIFGAAQAAGLQVTITSAFRSSDFPSRHAFGEAVDIAIRNPPNGSPPSQPWSSNSQIAKLVQIGKDAGFKQPTGDTLDEYNRPIEGRTSGGHVHIEFNKISADASYCAPYPNPPAPI